VGGPGDRNIAERASTEVVAFTRVRQIAHRADRRSGKPVRFANQSCCAASMVAWRPTSKCRRC